jgi:hypothetical protein
VSFEIRDARDDDQVSLHAIHHRATMSSYGRDLGWLDPILADPATPLEIVEWTIVAADPGGALGYAAVTATISRTCTSTRRRRAAAWAVPCSARSRLACAVDSPA